eukprot:g2811.t1
MNSHPDYRTVCRKLISTIRTSTTTQDHHQLQQQQQQKPAPANQLPRIRFLAHELVGLRRFGARIFFHLLSGFLPSSKPHLPHLCTALISLMRRFGPSICTVLFGGGNKEKKKKHKRKEAWAIKCLRSCITGDLLRHEMVIDTIFIFIKMCFTNHILLVNDEKINFPKLLLAQVRNENVLASPNGTGITSSPNGTGITTPAGALACLARVTGFMVKLQDIANFQNNLPRLRNTWVKVILYDLPFLIKQAAEVNPNGTTTGSIKAHFYYNASMLYHIIGIFTVLTADLAFMDDDGHDIINSKEELQNSVVTGIAMTNGMNHHYNSFAKPRSNNLEKTDGATARTNECDNYPPNECDNDPPNKCDNDPPNECDNDPPNEFDNVPPNEFDDFHPQITNKECEDYSRYFRLLWYDTSTLYINNNFSDILGTYHRLQYEVQEEPIIVEESSSSSLSKTENVVVKHQENQEDEPNVDVIVVDVDDQTLGDLMNASTPSCSGSTCSSSSNGSPISSDGSPISSDGSPISSNGSSTHSDSNPGASPCSGRTSLGSMETCTSMEDVDGQDTTDEEWSTGSEENTEEEEEEEEEMNGLLSMQEKHKLLCQCRNSFYSLLTKLVSDLQISTIKDSSTKVAKVYSSSAKDLLSSAQVTDASSSQSVADTSSQDTASQDTSSQDTSSQRQRCSTHLQLARIQLLYHMCLLDLSVNTKTVGRMTKRKKSTTYNEKYTNETKEQQSSSFLISMIKQDQWDTMAKIILNPKTVELIKVGLSKLLILRIDTALRMHTTAASALRIHTINDKKNTAFPVLVDDSTNQNQKKMTIKTGSKRSELSVLPKNEIMKKVMRTEPFCSLYKSQQRESSSSCAAVSDSSYSIYLQQQHQSDDGGARSEVNYLEDDSSVDDTDGIINDLYSPYIIDPDEKNLELIYGSNENSLF